MGCIFFLFPTFSQETLQRFPWWMRYPIYANNWRWHGDGDYDLKGRDAAIVAMRSQGLSQAAIGELHGLTKGQVSKRLAGRRPSTPFPGSAWASAKRSARPWKLGDC